MYSIPALSSSFLVNLHCVQAGFEYSVTVIFSPFGIGVFLGLGI